MEVGLAGGTDRASALSRIGCRPPRIFARRAAFFVPFCAARANYLKSKTLLTLSMNSGTRIPILFTDENFLKKVLNVLEEVMKAGSIGHQNITVNIKGCDIHGNAKILTDMGIK